MRFNDRELSPGELMTLHSALNSLIEEMLEPDALGSDDHGKAMQEGYLHHAQTLLREVLAERGRAPLPP